MLNKENDNNPLLAIISATFDKTATADLNNYYLKATAEISKWTCYSDYCFDDPNKPNNVVCFTLIPYVQDFESLSRHIKSLAAVDIKKTRKVQEEFTTFLKEYPLVNFSFILTDRKRLLGKDYAGVINFLHTTYTLMRDQYKLWSKNQPEQKEQYLRIIKKINCLLTLIEQRKKIPQIIDMTLVTFYGAYVSSRIINNGNIESFGWFSDRDALNEVCDYFSIDLFRYYLHGLTEGIDFNFFAAAAGSKDNPFYEDLVRIPDYIAGALADYNSVDNVVSKDKFNTMLTNYMADNIHNNFVFRLFTVDEGLASSRITIQRTPEDESD